MFQPKFEHTNFGQHIPGQVIWVRIFLPRFAQSAYMIGKSYSQDAGLVQYGLHHPSLGLQAMSNSTFYREGEQVIENSNSRRYLAVFLKNPKDFVILPPWSILHKYTFGGTLLKNTWSILSLFRSIWPICFVCKNSNAESTLWQTMILASFYGMPF